VADADSLRRLTVEPPGEVDELALDAPAFDMTVDQGGYAGRIIAAPEPFEKTCGPPSLGL
jgi:hypothetical protein